MVTTTAGTVKSGIDVLKLDCKSGMNREAIRG
jgi:hypothetical protein